MDGIFLKTLYRVSRQDVENCDPNPMAGRLNKLLKDAETVRHYAGNVEMVVEGYDDDPRELHQIEEVRRYLTKLDKEFPHLFWFLSSEGVFLRVLLFCICQGRPKGLLGADFDDRETKEFMERHYSAMEVLGARFNLSSEEINYRQQQVEKCFKSHYVGSTYFDSATPEIIEGLNPFSREYVRGTKGAKFDTEVSTKKAGFWEWIKAKFNPSNWR